MEISKIKKGTFLTFKNSSNVYNIYLVAKREPTISDGTVKIFTSMTHICERNGKYVTTDSFKRPYEFKKSELDQKLEFTDQATIDKIQEAFEKNGKRVNILS